MCLSSFYKLLHGFVKLLHEFVKVVTSFVKVALCIPKLKFEQDFKVSKSKYSMPWVCRAFGNVFSIFFSILLIFCFLVKIRTSSVDQYW